MIKLPEKLINTFISVTVPQAIKDEIAKWLRDFETEDISEETMGNFGGDVFIVDKLDDLNEVEGLHLTDRKEFYQRLDRGPASFDICERVGEEYIICTLMTNNGGGDSYFIPKEFWTDNVLNSKDINGKSPRE